MRFLVLLLMLLGPVALTGCGSATEQTQATTLAGVGVKHSGPPPTPDTPTACASRWNGAANTSGRATAKQKAAKADAAIVESARRGGYFSEDAGRCLVWLITPSKGAVVFVESAPGKFVFTADASGYFTANADLRQDGQLHLR
jgi:hypothetical protein